MKRYLGRPARSEFYDYTQGIDYLARTVIEPAPLARDTGLLDAQGQQIFSVDEIGPIGFIHLKERP